MPSTYSTPTAFNTYQPNFIDGAATDALIVSMSRSAASFRLNQYGQMRVTGKKSGLYLRINPENSTRILYGDGRDHVWPDGSDSPTGLDNQIRFEAEAYKTIRYAFSDTLGQQAIEQAAFMVEALQQAQLVTQAMTMRTNQAATALSGATWGSNTGIVDGVAGGTPGTGVTLTSGQNWSNGTESAPNVKTTLFNAASIIKKGTGGVVDRRDLVLVMNPDTAISISTSSEIQKAFIQSPIALAQARGDAPVDAEWGLPTQLYGIPLVIEDAVITSTAVGAATLTQNYIMPKGTAYLLARRGGPVEFGDETTKVVSTLMGFFYEELTAQSRVDGWERRVTGRITTDFSYQITSPLTGFQFTHCLGA